MYYYGIASYTRCVFFIVVAIVIVFKKVIVVVYFFAFYSLLSIDLCLSVLSLVNTKVFVILIIRYCWCLINNLWYLVMM